MRSSNEALARVGDRLVIGWLVVVDAGAPRRLEVYRAIYSQLGPETGFQKVVAVVGDGHVEELASTPP